MIESNKWILRNPDFSETVKFKNVLCKIQNNRENMYRYRYSVFQWGKVMSRCGKEVSLSYVSQTSWQAVKYMNYETKTAVWSFLKKNFYNRG